VRRNRKTEYTYSFELRITRNGEMTTPVPDTATASRFAMLYQQAVSTKRNFAP